jgi:acetyl esterase
MPLDDDVRKVLDMMAAAGPTPVDQLEPVSFREVYAGTALAGSHPEVLPDTEDRTIAGPAGDLVVRIYRPEASGPLPLVVYAHGGGWVIGDLDTHDGVCEHLAVGTPAVVVSVHYRRAPEDRFPAAVEDVVAAVTWAHAHAAELGADPDRLAVAGDSAGGNLAAVAVRRLRDAGGPPVAFQLLLYPVCDCTMAQPSYQENASGYLLDAEVMAWFIDAYLGGSDPADPDASPLFAGDLAGLPPALVVTAEFDPLRDEGEAYARRLAEAGVPTTCTRYDGTIHGFVSLAGVLESGRRAMDDVVVALRAALA